MEKETRLNIRLEPKLLERLDVICVRLGGCTRTQVIKMLLSSDPKVLQLLFEKAQNITFAAPAEAGQLTFEEVENSNSTQKKKGRKKN